MLLEVEDLSVNYGHIEAIRHLSFSVEEGTVATLIGANGAGKSTTLKTISGLRKIRTGRVLFDGQGHRERPVPRAGRARHLSVARGARASSRG